MIVVVSAAPCISLTGRGGGGGGGGSEINKDVYMKP